MILNVRPEADFRFCTLAGLGTFRKLIYSAKDLLQLIQATFSDFSPFFITSFKRQACRDLLSAMLTVAKLAVLIKYRWDNHLFKKQASAQEKELLADIDWDNISEVLQDLTRYHRQLVSAEYAKKILADLRQVCADDETAQTLLGYASTL